jgi:hypothetical protein
VLQTEATQQQHFERGLREVFEAGDGVLTLTVIGPASAASLIAAVVAGDVAAKVVLNAADQLLRRIQRRSRARALPCVLCDDNALWRGAAPHTVAIGEDRSEAELGMAAVAKLRAEWMPGLRTFLPTPEVGHA